MKMESNVEYPETSSPAQALVRLAAYRIDLSPARLGCLFRRLDEEYVTEIWQLKSMDSLNWQILGAPLGVVTAVRACLQEEEKSGNIDASQSMLLKEQQRVSDISNSSISDITTSRTTSDFTTSLGTRTW